MLLGFNKVYAQQITSVEMQVTGLTCSMCSQATEKSLRTLKYISAVQPDLNKNTFKLSFQKGADVSFDQLKKKVKDAGFSVGNLSATLQLSQAKVDEQGQMVIDGQVYRFANLKNKVLNGAVKVNIIDKNFISNASFKQKAAQFKNDSYASGIGEVNGKKTRIYHLSI